VEKVQICTSKPPNYWRGAAPRQFQRKAFKGDVDGAKWGQEWLIWEEPRKSGDPIHCVFGGNSRGYHGVRAKGVPLTGFSSQPGRGRVDQKIWG